MTVSTRTFYEAAVGLVLQVVVTAALAAWGRWVARRRGDRGVWKWAPRAPWISFALLTVGFATSAVMLARAFTMIEKVDASSKASKLAEGVERAMQVGLLGFVPGYLVLIVFVIACAFGSLARPVAPPADHG